MSWRRGRFHAVSMLILAAVSCSSGGSAIHGSVSGTVFRAPSDGVSVTLSCSSIAFEKTTTTDAFGHYAFDDLPGATCTVTPTLEHYLFEPASVAVDTHLADAPRVDFAARRVLQVFGTDIAAYGATVAVMHAGEAVDDAAVWVNGELIPLAPTPGHYSGSFANALSPGQTISLEVRTVGSTVTGSGTIPEAPGLTSPLAGATFSPGEDVVVTWTAATEPDYFEVIANWSCGPWCGTGTSFVAAAAARAFTIPASSLPSGDVEFSVFAYNDGTLGGDYTPYLPYPGMNIRAESQRVTVSR